MRFSEQHARVRAFGRTNRRCSIIAEKHASCIAATPVRYRIRDKKISPRFKSENSFFNHITVSDCEKVQLSSTMQSLTVDGRSCVLSVLVVDVTRISHSDSLARPLSGARCRNFAPFSLGTPRIAEGRCHRLIGSLRMNRRLYSIVMVPIIPGAYHERTSRCTCPPYISSKNRRNIPRKSKKR